MAFLFNKLPSQVSAYIQSLFRKFGFNLAKNSRALGLTPAADFEKFMQIMFPMDNGHRLIRVGPNGDGGYVIPDDLVGISYCFSPGSDLLWEFEREIGERYQITSYICDSLIKKPNDLSEMQVFKDAWLGPSTGGNFISFADWIHESIDVSRGEDLLLQIDIEGAEYLALLALPDDMLLKFRVIIMEGHSLDALMNRFSFEEFLAPVFRRLARDYDLVYLHGNNCCGLWNYRGFTYPRIAEFTWHRKDRRFKTPTVTQVKTVLDYPNIASVDEIRFERPKS